MMAAEVSKGAFAGIVVAGAWCSVIKEIVLLIKTCDKYKSRNSEVLLNCTKLQGCRFQEGRGFFHVISEMLIYRTIIRNIDFVSFFSFFVILVL